MNTPRTRVFRVVVDVEVDGEEDCHPSTWDWSARLAAYVTDIESRLGFDPTTAREQLRRMLLDGKLTMTHLEDGTWQASSALLVGRIGANKTPKPQSGGPSGASSVTPATSSSEVVEIGSCAGWN
jgi:hypothetical protein